MSVSVELTATQVKAFGKKTSDIYDEKLTNARDIGKISVNKARLNVVATLAKGETEDWYSFDVMSQRGSIKLRGVNVSEMQKEQEDKKKKISLNDVDEAAEKTEDILRGKKLRIEIYTKQGNRETLVATNDKSKRKENLAFEQMVNGEFKTGKGRYYIHVTGEDGKPVKEDTLYTLQVQLGDKYTQDYTTEEMSVNYANLTEKQVKEKIKEERGESVSANSQLSGKSLMASSATSILSAGYTYTAEQRTDQSASARLFSLLV